MDVGYFISDLLGEHGDVSVPGLGYFAHTRVNGYYNDKESRFYPPRYSVQFDPQFIDDDTLAQHIADNKNISLASSKYFAEKYVAGIRQQVVTGEVTVANLGWFYMDDEARLAFRSNSAPDADPEFFGLPPLQLYKLGQKPANAPAEIYTPAPVTASADETTPEVEAAQFETDVEHEQYLVELTAKRRRKTLLVFLALALALGALVYLLYIKYDKSAFNLEEPAAKPKITKTVKPKRVLVKPDSSKVADADDTIRIVKFDQGKKVYVPEPDTLAKKIAQAPVELPAEEGIASTAPRYEILGGAVATTADANIVIAKYRKLGFKARVLDNVPGRKRKITLGTYATRDEAIAAQQKIIASGKIQPAEIYIQPYNVK